MPVRSLPAAQWNMAGVAPAITNRSMARANRSAPVASMS